MEKDKQGQSQQWLQFGWSALVQSVVVELDQINDDRSLLRIHGLPIVNPRRQYTQLTDLESTLA